MRKCRGATETADDRSMLDEMGLAVLADLLGLLLMCVFASGQGLAAAAQQRDDPEDIQRTSVIRALDRGVQRLAGSDADYRIALRETLRALPPAFKESIGRDIDAFLTRAPGTGADFKCSAAFVRDRARKELGRIRDTLVGAQSRPLEPEFCYALPYAVDTSQIPGQHRTVELYGYDFDRVPLELFLVEDGGHPDVTFALTMRTHYHVTVNLGPGGVPLSSKSHFLGLTWGNLIHGAVPIIQGNSTLCSSRVEDVPRGKEVTSSMSRPRTRPRALSKATRIWAKATLEYSDNGIETTICSFAENRGDPSTTVGGCETEFVATVDADRVIEGIVGKAESHTSATIGRGQRNAVRRRGSGVVDRWTFTGFGTDPGSSEPDLTVRFNRIRIVSTESYGCVSPVAYLEARRMNALSAATLGRLNPQLTASPAAVLRLRPRFAIHR
jgi:hypothetical protein